MKKKLFKLIIGLFIFSSSAFIYGQTTKFYNRCKASELIGNAVVEINQSNTYSLDTSCRLLAEQKDFKAEDMEWYVSSNGILKESDDGTSVTLTFKTSGIYTLYFDYDLDYRFDFSKKITVNNPPTPIPLTPPTPLLASNTCSSPTITRFGSPGTDIKWYWQTSASGTSTALGSETILTIETSGNYYLRALSTMYGRAVWSANSSAPISVSVIPCPDFSNENYRYTTIPKIKTTDVASLTTNQKKEAITYYDGLGRPKQNIAIRTGKNQQDIVTHIAYDGFGRQTKEYLPYASTEKNGYIKNNALVATNTYYTTHYASGIDATNPNPFSEKIFDNSPLNRVMEQAAPGKDWAKGNGHTIKFDYQTNITNEVLNFGVEFTGGNTDAPKLKIADSYYNAGELYKTITKDENWKTWEKKDRTTEEFKNKQGQVVLKRTYNNQQAHDTYYVYDDFGNLTYVLPPLASEKTIIYKTGMQSYPASKFVTGGNATGTVKFGIEKTGPGQYRYVADFDLHNLANSNFKSGEIMELPFFSPSMRDFWMGSVSVSDYSNRFWAYKYVSFYVSNGKLMCYAYEYNRNNIPLAFSNFDSRRTTNLPQNLQGFSEVATQEKVTELLDKLCYQYKYDHRNRLIEKKIPGKEWESIVYNLLDQPVLTQDENLKIQGKWLFTKYDAFGRVCFTGIHNLPNSRALTQEYASNKRENNYSQYLNRTSASQNLAGTTIYYTNKAIPHGVHKIHTINYYDTYVDLPSGFTPPTKVLDQDVTTDTKGLPTVSKVRVLETAAWITNLTYYDDKARPIYIYSKNDYLNTIDIVEHKLDFIGKVLETRTTHKKTGKDAIITKDIFKYDHADRLISQTQQINSQEEELIVKNNYDELGQLVKKDVGNTAASPLQEVDYTYNIRGWLKKINDQKAGLGTDLFATELLYNDLGSNLRNNRLYNGNISQAIWKTANDNAGRYYNYHYDDLNRIRSAYYYSWRQYSRFNLGSISYDKNGNLQRLYRRGAIVENPDINNTRDYGTMDYLTYSYDGNQLLNVKDTGNKNYGFKDGTNTDNDYTYDANGNMKTDANKGINKIEYNHLNLPKKIEFSGQQSEINYRYDATGNKLEKRVSGSGISETTTQYAGNYIYKNNDLQFFNTSEGYASPKSDGNFEYIYQYKDHLGNVRLSYTENHDIDIPETVFTDNATNTQGWDSNGALYGGSATVTTDKSYSGGKSLKIHSTTGTGYYSHCNEWMPINNSEPTEYTFSGRIFVESAGYAWGRISLFMNEDDETGYFTEVFDGDAIKTKGQWVYYEKTVIVPTNIDKINLRINLYHQTNTATAWFDDLKIVKGNLSRTTIVEESNYYPFGLKHKGYNSVVSSNGNSTAQKKLYNGKELQDELGLNRYDYGWRNYMPDIGRFDKIDRFAEKYENHTPYHYAANSPLLFKDVKGDSLVVVTLRGLNTANPTIKNRSFLVDESIAQNVVGFVNAAQKQFKQLTVNNIFRAVSSSKIKTGNTKAKKLSRHQAGFAIDLNGVKSLNKKQLNTLNKIAGQFGFKPLQNQSSDPPHFSINPTSKGFKSLKAGVTENKGHFDQLVNSTKKGKGGITTSALTDKKGNVIGFKFTKANNSKAAQQQFNKLIKELISNAK